MSELHVETYQIARETDVGFLTQISKVSEYMNSGIYVTFISGPGMVSISDHFSRSSIFEKMLFYIRGSQTSGYVRIVRGCLLKMKMYVPLFQRF